MGSIIFFKYLEKVFGITTDQSALHGILPDGERGVGGRWGQLGSSTS